MKYCQIWTAMKLLLLSFLSFFSDQCLRLQNIPINVLGLIVLTPASVDIYICSKIFLCSGYKFHFSIQKSRQFA